MSLIVFVTRKIRYYYYNTKFCFLGFNAGRMDPAFTNHFWAFGHYRCYTNRRLSVRYQRTRRQFPVLTATRNITRSKRITDQSSPSPTPPPLIFWFSIDYRCRPAKEWRRSPPASAVQLLAAMVVVAGGAWHLWCQHSRLRFLFLLLLLLRHCASREWPQHFNLSPKWSCALSMDSLLSNPFPSTFLLQVLLSILSTLAFFPHLE